MASIVSALGDSAAFSASSSTVEREYDHILQVLLEGDNIVVTSLLQNKVKTLRDLFDFLKDQGKVNALKAKTKKGKFVNVPQNRKVELGFIISFINDLQNSYGTISLSPYPIVNTTRDQFEMFVSRGIHVTYDPNRADKAQERRDAMSSSSPIQTVTTPTTTTIASTSALEAFKKKLTLSKDRCPNLSNKAEWTTYYIAVKLECALTDCEEVLDGSYQVPPSDVELDKKKQVLVMSLLNMTVRSLEGKPIVRKHATAMTARLCWQELMNIHMKDVSGTNRAKHFFALITNSQVPSSPKKSLTASITEFEEWCTEYNTYCDPNMVLSDQLRYQLLENFLANVKELVSIEESLDISDAQSRSQGKPLLTFGERIELYKRRASIVDEKNKVAFISQRRHANMNRSVHVSERDLYDSYDNEDDDVYGDDGYYADGELNVHAAAAAGFGRRRGQVPKDVYDSLDPSVRKIWLSMPAEAREKILTCLVTDEQTDDPSTYPSGTQLENPSPTGTLSANLHRSALRTPISRGSRATLSATSPSNGIITAAEANMTTVEANNTISANLSLTQAIARGPIAAHQSKLLPSDIYRMMSSQDKSPVVRQRIGVSPSDVIPRKRNPTVGSTPSNPTLLTPNALKESQQDRHPTRRAHFTAISHDDGLTSTDAAGDTVDDVAASAATQVAAGLVDKGTNNGFTNQKQMRLLYYAEPKRSVNVNGTGDLNINRIPIGTFAARVRTQHGSIIIVCPEYGEMKTGTTIHSVIQFRNGGCTVHDDPKALGGKQCLITPRGFVIPLDIKNGLPYMQMHFPSDEDLENLPHEVLTRNVPWDPRVYDLERSDNGAVCEQVTEVNFATVGEHLPVYGEHDNAASDTVCASYADLTAWGGITAAQVFTGTLLPHVYIAVYGCQSNADSTLIFENGTRKWGAMNKLIIDLAKGKKAENILQVVFIQDWHTGIGHHISQDYTDERVYILVCGEFGDKDGHVSLIKEALYGWYERFNDVLHEMGFRPSLVEHGIWMRACNSNATDAYGEPIQDMDLFVATALAEHSWMHACNSDSTDVNGEPLSQDTDLFVTTDDEEHLPRRHTSHLNVTTTIADLLSRDTTNDIQLIQEYLARTAPTSAGNPQEPMLPPYRRTEPVGSTTIIGDSYHTAWHTSIIEELHRNVRYRNDITLRRYTDEMDVIFERYYEDDIGFQFPRQDDIGFQLPRHLRLRLFLLSLHSINPFQNVNENVDDLDDDDQSSLQV